MPTHPLSRIPQRLRPAVFVILLLATLLIMLILNLSGSPLRNDNAPAGIVSFELAGTAERAGAILDSWDPEAKIYAAFNLGFDFLWIPFYSTTIALGLLWTAESLNLKGRRGATLAAFWPGANGWSRSAPSRP